MAKQYSPSVVEKSWYASWESSGYFVEDPSSTKPPFVMDAMIRWRRMSGGKALWVSGVDHAALLHRIRAGRLLIPVCEWLVVSSGCLVQLSLLSLKSVVFPTLLWILLEQCDQPWRTTSM
ncbi:hypothetical protein ACQJBY_047827 [Aegilops geniculata]